MAVRFHHALLARVGRLPAGSEADLLRRYAATGDEQAFAALVELHAPLVWGVCRRSPGNHADCEDAFQATFLALVRQAHALDVRRPLAPWLYAVALRTSRKAAARRRPWPLTEEPAAAGDPVSAREIGRAIDEEIGRLPRPLRDAVVACCLGGESREDAAVALGCSPAAVKSRLERARGRLRAALTRRGVELPTALTVLFLGCDRASAELIEQTAALAHGPVPAAVAGLLKAGLSLASVGSLLAVSVGFACCLTVAASALHPEQKAQAQPAPTEKVPPAAKPMPPVDGWGDPLPAGAVRRFGTVRLRQPYTHALQFTPDGKALVAGKGCDPLGVFDVTTGRKLRDVGEHAINNPYRFCLTPDGKQVFCLGYNVTLWDLTTGELVRRYTVGRCSSVAAAPDGKSFVAQLERRAILQHVETATGRVLAEQKMPFEEMSESRLEFDAAGTGVVFQPQASIRVRDGQYRVDRLSLRRWDLAANTVADLPLPADAGVPKDFALLPGSKAVAFVAGKGPVVLWEPETQKVLRTLAPAEKDAAVTALAASGDGRRIAARTKAAIHVLDAVTGKSLLKVALEPSRATYETLALSPDGRRLAHASGIDSRVRLWDVDVGTELLPDAGHRLKPELNLSADGGTLISWTYDEEYHWDLKTGRGVKKPRSQEFNPPPSPFTSKTSGKLWDVTIDDKAFRLIVTDKAGKEIASCPTPRQNSRGIAISDDGRHLAVSFQDRAETLIVWTPTERDEPFVITGHPDACQRLNFSHDGKTLFAAAGTHNSYPVPVNYLYDVATGKRLRTLACNSSPGYAVFTADDRVLVTGGLWNDATCRAWDASTGEQLAVFADPTLRLTTEPGTPKALANIEAIQFSPDERLLAVASGIDDRTSIAVWEVATWKLVKSFPPTTPRLGHATMRFSRDGRSLFVANPDTTVLEWDVCGRFGQTPPPLSAKRLDELAAKLADRDGYPAVWELIDRPEQTFALFRGPLSPAALPTAKDVDGWIAGLDAPAFRDREAAQKNLLAQGDSVVPALEAAAKASPSAEVANRIETLLGTLRARQSPAQLRQRRTVAVLDLMPDPRAKALLAEYAKGDDRLTLTREAKKALPPAKGK